MSKLKSRLFSGALAVMMMLAMLVTVGTTTVSAENGLFTTPSIYKEILKDAGTTTPTQAVTYEVAKEDFNGTGTTTNLPAIDDVVISFAAGDTGTAQPNGTVKVTKSEAIDIPSTGISGFAKAGEYVYIISEKDSSAISESNATMSKSQVQYRMHVFVQNASGGGIEIAGIAVYQITDENGVEITNPEKIDADTEATGIAFSSTYRKIAGSKDVTGTTDYTSFKLSKTTEGSLADLDQTFTFTLNFKASPLHTASGTYTYSVMEGATTVSTNTFTLSGAGATETVTVNLKNGQEVVFINLPTGTTFYGVETGFGSYVPTGTLITNGQEISPTLSAEAGEDLLINVDSAQAPNTLLGENTNSAAVKNTYNSVSITGILLDNLPFIILIAVGVAGFGFYAVNRKRNAVR